MSPFNVLKAPGGSIIKAWTVGVPFEDSALRQVENVASLPFVQPHIAVMPDVHWGMGATVGSVIPTVGAIIPAAVGVDLGCGMSAVRTTLTASELPDDLFAIRCEIEAAVPHGRTDSGGANDRGAWGRLSNAHATDRLRIAAWEELREDFLAISYDYDRIGKGRTIEHLGTLGTGNHFIELCLDEEQRVWVMLHSGSRGVGNRIGSFFIAAAKREMEKWHIHLPDADLAYLPEGSEYFKDYIDAVSWAQAFALKNREIILAAVLEQLACHLPPFELAERAVNCHHNYVAREHHFGKDVWLTRKGAVRARLGDLGIIPGSMGAKSFIVRGLGNAASFHSCSHGAGRVMSRTQARDTISLGQHKEATAGVECRKDFDVLDESPAAYKPIDAVMAAQTDLVEIVHTLKQVLCVKG